MMILYIGLAGALGSMSRYALGAFCTRIFNVTAFPVGTFAVNLLGSLLMGFAMGFFAARGGLDTRLRFVLTIGFLGGFTTYSSFALETVGLLEERALGSASFYVGLTLASAGVACFIGLSLGRRL